jgi:hypothetical protein
MKYRMTTLLATSAAAALLCAGAAWADDQAAPAPAAAAPAAPTSWFDGIKYKAQLEVGTTLNPDTNPTGLNWGHAFTDQQNKVLLNGLALTAERDPDTSSKTVDIGFKIQASYGSDARYTQLIGQFNRSINSIDQFDLVEANLQAHLPYITPGGMEVKVGQYGTYLGEEVIDPSGNFFYSHTYIFNFGIPLKHTGLMTETHVTPQFDLYLGIDSGVNTFLGSGGGANDNAVHFEGGFGLNLTNLTVVALTHIGPEDYTYPCTDTGSGELVVADIVCSSTPAGVHGKNRYLSDVVITYTGVKNLTAVLEGNYAYDELAKDTAGGVAGYLEYAITPELTIGGRVEVFVDANNFFVAGFPGHFDFINYAGGYGPSTPVFGYPTGKGFTYGEFTLGLNYKPAKVPASLSGLVVRPEFRYDTAFSGGSPYDPKWDGFEYAGTKKDQFTFGLDVVIPFKL